MIKAWLNTDESVVLDKEHLVFFSYSDDVKDKAQFYSEMFGVEMGLLYQYRDLSVIINGRSPIVEIRISASDIQGKDAVIITDMITGHGETIIESANQLKKHGAKSVTVLSTFEILDFDLSELDNAFSQGLIKSIYCTNLTFHGNMSEENNLLKRKWFIPVDMTKYLAFLIDTINHKESLDLLLDDSIKIREYLKVKNKL